MGVYFWIESNPRIGKRALHTGLQGSFLLASSILYGSLLVHHEYLDTDVATKNILERRLAFQRITTVAFYALWGINIIDAQRSWQIEQQSRNDVERVEYVSILEQKQRRYFLSVNNPKSALCHLESKCYTGSG